MTATPPSMHITRGGDASPEEVAAIVAALEVTAPRAAAPSDPEPQLRWRFSGRWWSRPVPLRRNRPW